MKKIIIGIIAVVTLTAPPARADMFGGDVVVLVQILANALKQLIELKNIVDNGRDNLDLLREINRGINDSLSMIRTVSPDSDPGLYKDWENAPGALAQIEAIYGAPVESRDQHVQRDTDESVAEAVSFNNSIYKYTNSIDEIGELIKQQSHVVSPGGAAKLTAQSMGVMIHIQNESLRAQATGLKLQAQALMLQNRKDKERTRQMVAGADNLQTALATQKPKFTLPRFE